MITYWQAFGIAVGLWFAQSWYFNVKLDRVNRKLDHLCDCFHGLKEYLYEIDPQFDDERQSLFDLYSEDRTPGIGLDIMELEKRKKADGFRTLNSTFLDGGHSAPNQ